MILKELGMILNNQERETQIIVVNLELNFQSLSNDLCVFEVAHYNMIRFKT